MNGDVKKWKFSIVFDFTCVLNIEMSVVKVGEKGLHVVNTTKKGKTVISISSITQGFKVRGTILEPCNLILCK